MNHAIWIGRQQVKGLIILLALLPLIPTSLLVHTLWQEASRDQELALDDLNQRMIEQFRLAVENFSERRGNTDSPGEFASFLLHILGSDVPIQIVNHQQQIVFQSQQQPIGDKGISYQLESGKLKDWQVDVDTVSMITYSVAEENRLTLTQTVFSLLGTFLIAGCVWFAVSRNLRIDDMRKDLITTISHEIKTPVSAIKILTESLENGKLDNKTREEYIELIGLENHRIEKLANRFLTYSRLESGQLPLDCDTETPLDEVISEVIIAMQPGFDAAKGTIERIGDDQMLVKMDRTGLTIILTNLLENALKYGGSPPLVRVESQVTKDKVNLIVSDNGPGISPEERNAVFQQFYRSGGRLDDGQTGTGLGLSICRRIAKEMKLPFELIESNSSDLPGASFSIELSIVANQEPQTI